MFQMTQMFFNPSRITKSSQTLIDFIFTNKPDRIKKTYDLITGLSDHNPTLALRKLTKACYRNQNSMREKSSMPFISQKDMALIENKIKQLNWCDTIGYISLEQACTDLMSTVKDILLKYTKNKGQKNKCRTKFTPV